MRDHQRREPGEDQDRHDRRDHQAADHRDRERLLQLRASADAGGERRQAGDRGEGGHQDRTGSPPRRRGERVLDGRAGVAEVLGVLEQQDAVLDDQADQQDAAGHRGDVERHPGRDQDAERAIKQVTQQVQTTPFSFLQKAESENLLTFIQDEHPQTIALILAHIPAQKASEILVGLPSQKQVEVVKRIANMEQTNPEVIKEVEQGLAHRLSDIVSQTFEKAGGVETVAEMLNLADRSTEKGIMEGLEAEDPDLVESIRRLMFVFEDILLVNDKGIQSVLKEIENDVLSLALKTASEELKQKIFKNMSERAAQLIAEDMQYMGPVRVSDVEQAQQKIVDVVRRLEDSGEIIIAGRGGEKEMVV